MLRWTVCAAVSEGKLQPRPLQALPRAARPQEPTPWPQLSQPRFGLTQSSHLRAGFAGGACGRGRPAFKLCPAGPFCMDGGFPGHLPGTALQASLLPGNDQGGSVLPTGRKFHCIRLDGTFLGVSPHNKPGRGRGYPHFTDEETDVHRGYESADRSGGRY